MREGGRDGEREEGEGGTGEREEGRERAGEREGKETKVKHVTRSCKRNSRLMAVTRLEHSHRTNP
jgi:hypothetical protein